MSVERRIDEETLMQLVPSVKTRTIMWHGHALTVKRLLDMKEASELVDCVVGACTDGGTFTPELFDFIFKLKVVTMYGCVDVIDDVNLAYEVIYETDIYDEVVGVVNSEQIEALRMAALMCLKCEV